MFLNLLYHRFPGILHYSFTFAYPFIYLLHKKLKKDKTFSSHLNSNFCVLLVSNYFPSSHTQELRPKGMDIRQEELGDLVDKEMSATSAAIEEAVRRIDVSADNLTVIYNKFTRDKIQLFLTDKCYELCCMQEMMNQTRKDTTGIKLEVNERFAPSLISVC